jgi:hypothetical protein
MAVHLQSLQLPRRALTAWARLHSMGRHGHSGTRLRATLPSRGDRPRLLGVYLRSSAG